MIIIMERTATKVNVQKDLDLLKEPGFKVRSNEGEDHTVIDALGDKTTITPGRISAFEGVKVASVNTVTVKPKQKRVGRYTGFTSKTKKAIITLTADSKAIELFAAEAE